MWILGDHRLLCGDSSKPEDVDYLLDGARIGPDDLILDLAPGLGYSTAVIATGYNDWAGAFPMALDAIIAALSPGETRSATEVTIVLNNPLTAFAFGSGA